MGYLIALSIPLTLLAGLFVVTESEARRGTRFFASRRARLDERVGRVMFIVAHVDFGAFAHDLMRDTFRRVVHDCARFSLVMVRTVERFLARVVRRVRFERVPVAPPRENARAFVKTLSTFKDHLRETPLNVPDIY